MKTFVTIIVYNYNSFQLNLFDFLYVKKVMNNSGLLVGIIGLIIFMFGLVEIDVTQKNLIVFFCDFFLVFISCYSKGTIF